MTRRCENFTDLSTDDIELNLGLKSMFGGRLTGQWTIEQFNKWNVGGVSKSLNRGRQLEVEGLSVRH